jgi:hypothetical protein
MSLLMAKAFMRRLWIRILAGTDPFSAGTIR